MELIRIMRRTNLVGNDSELHLPFGTPQARDLRVAAATTIFIFSIGFKKGAGLRNISNKTAT
jgi:hypothetical protein